MTQDKYKGLNAPQIETLKFKEKLEKQLMKLTETERLARMETLENQMEITVEEVMELDVLREMYPPQMLGSFGRMSQKFLEQKAPHLIDALEMLLENPSYFHRLDSLAAKRKDEIMEAMREQTPPPDQSVDWLKYYQHNQKINDRADEIIQAELLYNLDYHEVEIKNLQKNMT